MVKVVNINRGRLFQYNQRHLAEFSRISFSTEFVSPQKNRNWHRFFGSRSGGKLPITDRYSEELFKLNI